MESMSTVLHIIYFESKQYFYLYMKQELDVPINTE